MHSTPSNLRVEDCAPPITESGLRRHYVHTEQHFAFEIRLLHFKIISPNGWRNLNMLLPTSLCSYIICLPLYELNIVATVIIISRYSFFFNCVYRRILTFTNIPIFLIKWLILIWTVFLRNFMMRSINVIVFYFYFINIQICVFCICIV